ncbi:hypothetical protein BKA69DRAFT_772761 [Paraphysoderma sedebokerense]|nr:hypothetical protein BKA69DRAFT_772761 [Paraphysoderma sedebokerense]
MNMPRHTSHGANLNPRSTQSSNESVAPINGRISSGRSHNSLYFGSFIFSPTAGSKKEKEETGNGKKESDQCSELEQQIRRCLVKLKENPNLASLFSVMFPNEVKPDSDLSLQGVSRQKEITDILRNMINILTDNHKLLIYLPEAQWMDSISWQITSDIIETCPRALFCLLSRPATHYANEHDLAIYEEIQQKISTTTIKLRGLTEQEITELIIETWNNLAVQAATAYPNQADSLARSSNSAASHAPSPLSLSLSSPFSNGSSSNYPSAARPRRISNSHFLNGDPDTECQLIRHVDQAVSSKVFKISGGNPLFAKSLIMTLRDRRLHSITADGKLIVPSDFDFDKIVPGSDLHSIIVSQFDRLDFMFQVFLKIASVLGQKFSLDDVLHFMLYENYSDSPKPVHQTVLRKQPQQLVKDIEQMDKYSFLTRIEEKDDDDNAGIWFSFKNSVIRESIYTTMLIAQKQKLHLSMAVYFESRMNHLNRHRLLIRIFEHYQQTDNSHIDKKLYYLEQICHLYFENNAMNEAISHYNDLLNMVQIKEDQTGKVLYDNVEKAKWHKELGDAYFASENLSLAEENLKKALALLNFYLPEPGVSLQIRTKLQLLQLKRNQARSTAKSAPSDPQRRIVHITRTVLASLSDVYAQMEKLEYWRYTTYCAQNLSEYLARDTTYAAFLAKAAYAMFTTRVNSSYAAKYIDFAMWIWERDQTPVLSNTLMIKEYTALITLLSGNWTQAAGKLNELMTECSKVGDLMKAERSMRLLLFVQFLQGNHNECKLLAIDLWNKSKEKNSWHGQFWCLVFTFLFDISLSASFSSREDMTYLNELVKKRFAALVEEADNTSKDGLYLYLTFQAINAEYDYRTRQDNSARFRNVMVRLRRLKAYHWQSLISIFIFLNLIFIAYDNDEVDMLAKNLGGTKVIVSFLQMVAKQMDKMWQITLAGQLKLVAQGLVFLVQDQKDKALAIWKRGLNQTKLWGNMSIVPAVSVQMEETSHNGTKPSFSSSVSPLPSQTNASHLLPTSSLPSFMVARDPGISTNPQYSNRFYHSDGFISAYLRHKLAKHGDTSLLNESIISTSSSLAVPKGSRPADMDAQDNHIAATAFTGSKQLLSGRVR